MAKNVVVAGDLVTQENLVQRTIRDSAHADGSATVALHPWEGGASRMAALIAIACGNVDVKLHLAQSNRWRSRSYALWTLHDQAAGSRNQVWRIRERLGDAIVENSAEPRSETETIGSPDLLVIDDQNLGFRDDPDGWPAALRDGGNPGRIILRTCAPLDEGPLWERLIDSYADRLDVLVPVSALRVRGASISQSLSWDRAIEETVAELESGISSGGGDLAHVRRMIVHFGSAGAAIFSRVATSRKVSKAARKGSETLLSRVRLESFLYHPDDQETDWEVNHPGGTLDSSAILAAAIVRHELTPESYPLYIATGRGMIAMRAGAEQGGGSADKFSLDAADHAIGETLNAADGREPAANYYSAFPHDLLDDPILKTQAPSVSNLLRDAIGTRLDYVVEKGIDIVLRGLEAALPQAPKCRYGHFLTADREEMERLNTIRNLILAYRENLGEKRPLSIAVFGPPGSGKSFAVKQLAAQLFAGQLSSYEFNLSQFENVDDLHQAFHQLRDGSVHGQIPFVFWDEFDSLNLKWLKEFLAPMQDAIFTSKGTQFPFGKVIFVFAGGTASSLAGFDRSGADDPHAADFRAAKGPDFVSRLRGFIDIKGPNPAAGQHGDFSHIIRRAIMLRSTVSRLYPRLIDSHSGSLSLSANVARAFLLAGEYLHGARSLEAIVSMSDLTHAGFFGPSNLPSADLLRIHVTADFQEYLREAQLDLPVIEALAAACHVAFRREREKQGYKWGAVRDDDAKTHPLLIPYDQLSEADKERNRVTARLTYAKLSAIGYRVERAGSAASAVARIPEEQSEELMRMEHDLWLREHLLRGYQWAPKTADNLRLHRDIVDYDELSAEDRALDAVPLQGIVEVMDHFGYVLVAEKTSQARDPQAAG